MSGGKNLILGNFLPLDLNLKNRLIPNSIKIMQSSKAKIIWTKTDEAPMLSSYSLLPIIKALTKEVGISIECMDISLAGRIIACFPEKIKKYQLKNDDLIALGEMTQDPEANIIKLPNISASVPQLKEAISELNAHGFDVPKYPDNPQSEMEKEIKTRYSAVLGSAVNPILREGNSDRRAAISVKNYAKNHPHKMGKWGPDSKSHVSSMGHGDFFANETSTTIEKSTTALIDFISENNEHTILKKNICLEASEIVDATFMSRKALIIFINRQIEKTKLENVLFSLHLKATMMKVSDPKIFGSFVKVFYSPVLEKNAEIIKSLNLNLDNGIGDLYSKLHKNSNITSYQREKIEADIKELYTQRPDLAMVDSDQGITNLHIPNSVIIDASMPVAIRNSGKMWGADGKLHDTNFIIPDSSYASLYSATIENCIDHGALDPAKMGTVQNIGLMAKKAEEYGSHPTTFEVTSNGKIRLVDHEGKVIHEHTVEKGDIWRLSRVKDEPVRDWIKLAVTRAKITGWPTIFWLDKKRAHGRELIKKVKNYLKEYDTQGLELPILSVYEAAKLSIERARSGLNTISVTGNVLRDYNTDLYPIIELGTSAKMLSIVPLMKGGGLFETGAGGSAPKHVKQFIEEGHLRWDSIGEFLALAESLNHLAQKTGNSKISILAKTLNQANEEFLNQNKSPSRVVNELDNRGSHFYLALYWAQSLASQEEDISIKKSFSHLAEKLKNNESKIINELNASQGKKIYLGGYYHPDENKVETAMRPSKTLNTLISSFSNKKTL